MSKRDFVWFAATALVAGAIAAALFYFAPAPAPPRPLQHVYYVWQKQWNNDVRSAVQAADAKTDGLLVLIGEVNAADQNLRLDPAYPDWAELARLRAPLTIVLRANAALSDLLQGEDRTDTIEFIRDAFAQSIADAGAHGAVVRGLQLDYDCPSSKLAQYRVLIGAIRESFDAYDLSMTALPTWLRFSEFAEMVDRVDYYVLQVHSLEAPRTVNDPLVLCDTDRVPGYARRAGAVGVPFYIALPTYGYRVIFDENGAFSALVAEGPEPELKPNQKVRTVMADTSELSALMRELAAEPPHRMLGIAWFRLPVAGDTLNWPWETLAAVREGRLPREGLRVELRSPSPGLHELWIVNSGETAPVVPLSVTYSWANGAPLAQDAHNGYIITQNRPKSVLLSGPAPRPHREVLAAWFRWPNAEVAGTAAAQATIETN